MYSIRGFCTILPMHYLRHRDDGVGFMATAEPGDGLPLRQAGEVWTPGGWSIAWHTNPGWELYVQAKGSSTWDIGGVQERVPEGGAYLVREGVRHRLRRMERGSHFYWVVFPHGSVPKGVADAACWRRTHTILAQAFALVHPLQGILRELAIREAWQADAVGWYLGALCATLARLAENLPGTRPWTGHPAAERARRLLESRLEHPWRLAELARLSGVSAPHLVAVFREDYGETPMRALLRLRTEEARRRLRETDATVTTIAMALGFSSSQHLARACRDAFNRTPTQLRGPRGKR
jgi:AraC-like DNA-binding protein